MTMTLGNKWQVDEQRKTRKLNAEIRGKNNEKHKNHSDIGGGGCRYCATQQANAQYTLQGNYLEVGVGADGSIINPSGTAPVIGGQYYSQFPGSFGMAPGQVSAVPM